MNKPGSQLDKPLDDIIKEQKGKGRKFRGGKTFRKKGIQKQRFIKKQRIPAKQKKYVQARNPNQPQKFLYKVGNALQHRNALLLLSVLPIDLILTVRNSIKMSLNQSLKSEYPI